MGVENSNHEERVARLKKVNEVVFTRGMTKEEYDNQKDLLVAPGWTVGKLIKAILDSGQIVWSGDRLQERKNGKK